MQQDPILPQNQPPATPQFSPTGTTPPSNRKPKHEGWKSALSTLAILIIAPMIAFMLTAFVFQSYEVDGPSMEPTLQDKDRLIVWKLPRTIARITGNAYLPERGDIIIFLKHDIQSFDAAHDRQLIKRVIALPGERVVVENNTITVYNSANPGGFNPDEQGDWDPVDYPNQPRVDLVVDKDEVFVVGDNRPNSLDSRTFGTISAKDIVGKLSFRIFPVNKADNF